MAARRVLAFACVLLTTAFLAGCSGDGDADPTPPPSATPSTSASSSASPTPTASPSSSSSSSSSAPAQPQTLAKDVLDNSFPDGTFTIRAGDTVVWTHRGSNPHSVSSTGNFDSHANCPPLCMLGGQTFTYTFDAAGTFEYVCKIHGSMTGTITVT